jgi:outer membrane protein OmpA-like peptidoglycan-associated protein
MSPAVLRTLCGSCLALGIADLTWLTSNSDRIVSRSSRKPIDDESAVAASAVVARAPAIAATPNAAPAVPTPVPSAASDSPLAALSQEPAVAPAEVVHCTVPFDRSHANLRPDETASLAAIAETLKNHPQAVVRVAGHADRTAWKANRGDNMTLSDLRATAVVRALGQLGVPPARIKRVAFGDTKPLDDRASEDAYRRNRRVEVRVDLMGEH